MRPAFAGATEEELLFLFRRLLRHAFEPLLHFLHLLAQIVDVAAIVRRGLRHLLGLATHARGERHEFREGLLEDLHVAADLLFERSKRSAGERTRDLLAELDRKSVV